MLWRVTQFLCLLKSCCGFCLEIAWICFRDWNIRQPRLWSCLKSIFRFTLSHFNPWDLIQRCVVMPDVPILFTCFGLKENWDTVMAKLLRLSIGWHCNFQASTQKHIMRVLNYNHAFLINNSLDVEHWDLKQETLGFQTTQTMNLINKTVFCPTLI